VAASKRLHLSHEPSVALDRNPQPDRPHAGWLVAKFAAISVRLTLAGGLWILGKDR